MKFTLNQLLLDELPNETAFQLVQFCRGLAQAMENLYFEQHFHPTDVSKQNMSSYSNAMDENDNPF